MLLHGNVEKLKLSDNLQLLFLAWPEYYELLDSEHSLAVGTPAPIPLSSVFVFAP